MEPDFEVVVVDQFGDHKVGDRITSRELIAALSAEEVRHVVRVARPKAPAAPATVRKD